MKRILSYVLLPLTLPAALIIVLAAAMVSRFSIEKEHFGKPF